MTLWPTKNMLVYYSVIHVTSSEETATYTIKDKNFTHDLLNYIISLNPKKLNNKNYKT